MEKPTDGSELADGERRIAEVYVPAVAEAVRKEHDEFIVNTPHDLPDADDGTGTGGVGAEYEGESDSGSGPESVSDGAEGEGETPTEPDPQPAVEE